MSDKLPTNIYSASNSNASQDGISIECIMRMQSVTPLYCAESGCDTKGCDVHACFMVCIKVPSYVIPKDISFEIGKIHDIIVDGTKNSLGTLKSIDRCGKGVILVFASSSDTSKEIKYYFKVTKEGYGVFFRESYIHEYCEFYYSYGTDEGCKNFNKE